MLWLAWLGSNNFVKIASSSKHSIPFTRSRVSQAMRSLHSCVCECYVCVCVSFSLSLPLSLVRLPYLFCVCCARLSRVSFALSHMDCIKSLSVCSRDSIMFHSQPPTHTHSLTHHLYWCCSVVFHFNFPLAPVNRHRCPSAYTFTHSLTQLGCITKLKSVFVLLAFLFYVSNITQIHTFRAAAAFSRAGISEISLAIES